MRFSIATLGCLTLSAISSVAASPVQRRTGEDYTLFSLPYGTGDLAPWISDLTNTIHLQLLQGAATGLHVKSKAISTELAKSTLDFVAINAAATALSTVSGALELHFLYFNSLAPKSQGGGDFSLASDQFKAQVKQDFGSYDGLIAALNAETLQVPASGWGFLVWDTKVKALTTTFTVDKTLLEPTLKPIINIDIFEHAFLIDTGSNKTHYLSNLEQIYNWKWASAQFANATAA